MADFKPIPIGVENFKRMIDGGYYFVDKTLMIKDILDNKSSVNLYTRPRRFGKTLNMSMLREFFEKTEKDNPYLFKSMSRADCPYDNAPMERYFNTLKSERIYHYTYSFDEQLNEAIINFAYVWCNHARSHSYNCGLTPAQKRKNFGLKCYNFA